MKILKHGNMKPRKFTCLNCGCEFVADTTEYNMTTAQGIVLWYRTECPECCNWTEKSEPWEEKDD